ncbi:MAG: hypothetical protein FWD90_00580 [Defluviitaleaceae bacterium]|nr:hypothetical protein [Defluviitaleaceae bacterium]
MKRHLKWIEPPNRLCKVLNNTRGESLMEGIISILIFTVLIATITMLVTTSFRITGDSLIRATERQNQVNTAAEMVTGLINQNIEINIMDGDDVSHTINFNITIHPATPQNPFIAFGPILP